MVLVKASLLNEIKSAQSNLNEDDLSLHAVEVNRQ